MNAFTSDEEARRAFREKIKSINFGRVPGGSKPPVTPDDGLEIVGSFAEAASFDMREKRAAEADALAYEYEGTDWLASESFGSTEVSDSELAD